MDSLLKTGDRIEVIEPLMSGWTGLAIVTMDQLYDDDNETIWFRKECDDPDDWFAGKCCALRYQVKKRKSTAKSPKNAQKGLNNGHY